MKALFNSSLFLVYLFILIFFIINIYILYKIETTLLYESYIFIYSFWIFIIIGLKIISNHLKFEEEKEKDV